MSYEITMNKGHFGWRAESHASLGETSEGERKIELSTTKRGNAISASVSVFIFKQIDGEVYSKSTVMFQDFYKHNLCVTPCKRVTEKAVRQAHNQALLLTPQLVEEATAFYAHLEAES